MNEFVLLSIVAFQFGQCPVKTEATTASSSSLNVQKPPAIKPKLTFVFAPPSDEPDARVALLMWSSGALDTFNEKLALFDPKAEASEREKQLLSVSSCLKKGNDGVYRLDIYLASGDTRYATLVRTLGQLKASIEPVLRGDAIICIRLSETLK